MAKPKKTTVEEEIVSDGTIGEGLNADPTTDAQPEPGGHEQHWGGAGEGEPAGSVPDIPAVVDAGSSPSGKRRGRAPGSGESKGGRSRGTAAEREEWRQSVAYTTAYLTSTAFGAFGRYRATRYRRVSPEVEKAVASCWRVPVQVTQAVGVPVAAYADRHLPERYKQAVSAVSEPAAIVAALWNIVDHCKQSEQRILAAWHERKTDERPESGIPDLTDVSPSPL